MMRMFKFELGCDLSITGGSIISISHWDEYIATFLRFWELLSLVFLDIMPLGKGHHQKTSSQSQNG